ncbi:hypothetical protein CGZ95_08910 [Enemella evansiae]|uniref:ribbon-helix-helix protein, CopG family n=1 Tax=Enemella evansiae TaxID=2016499 RepID=UPI000B967D3F|nr:ribbon-helix-helix protein, CopG family [Enemella evansiae]OYO00732.1 hypothetical protein CGZ95_08910 [Enemella evansiae]
MPPSKRLAISLSPEDAETLRLEAARLGTNVGLLIRALVRFGLDNLKDKSVREAIDLAMQEETRRRSAVGKAAMDSRYGRTPAQRQQQPVQQVQQIQERWE